MAVVQDDDAVRLAALITPPRALVLSTGHAGAIPCLIEGLGAAAIRPPGVSGLEPIAEQFAAAWRSRERAVAGPESGMNLYRATSIMAPAHVPAERRTAFGDDLEWLAAWQFRFAEQAGLSAAERTEDMWAVVAARLARGEMVVWIIGGRAVSSAAFLPSTPARDAGASMPYSRSRRSAAGVTHPPALPPSANGCRIAAGAICLIFADRDNPITTRIYQRLGYQKLATFSQMAFEDDG